MRKLTSVLARVGMLLTLMLLFSVPSFGQGDPHSIQVFVGYADNIHGGSIIPAPWAGDPGVVFVGSASPYDAGAVRIDNPSNQTVTIGDVSVEIGAASYDLWGPYPILIPPKGTLILTQTTQYDFDTSEPGITTCTPTGAIPVIHVTVGDRNPRTRRFTDDGQVLNTGGIDLAACGGGNEGHDWVRAHSGE